MGNRANIVLLTPTGYGPDHGLGAIYLYTHSFGDQWPEALREALEFGRSRWDDDQYLARIIVSRVFTRLTDETTGGGISLRIGDNSYPLIVCNLRTNTVGFTQEGHELADLSTDPHTLSFADYVAQDRATFPLSGVFDGAAV